MGGGDKPLLAIAGRPMLAGIIAALHPLPVAISANGDPARFTRFGCPVLDDGAFAGQGPLAGLLAGLEWGSTHGAEWLLSVPGDTPFIPRGLVDALAPAPACAASMNRRHPLVALWPIACREPLRALLGRPGSRAVGAFAQAVGMRVVDFPAMPFDAFTNVNTPEELAAARSQAARTAPVDRQG